VREALARDAVHADPRDPREDAGVERVAEVANARGGVDPLADLRRRRAEARDPGHVLGPRAALRLLRSAEDGVERRARADVERADPLRAADLVRGERQEVDVEVADREPLL